MKANELRIGNLVVQGEYPENAKYEVPMVVYGISRTLIAIDYIQSEESDEYIEINVDDISPIPLTEEWLLKLGYLPCSFAENHFYTKGHVVWKCNDQFLCDKNGVVLKSVHQLQNLYFAINGQELTLK